VGAGGSLEAAYELKGPIEAGVWSMVADCIVVQAVDVNIEIIHRVGSTDNVLVSWEDRYEPLPGGEYQAQAFDFTDEIGRVDSEPGDLLVLRYTGTNSKMEMAYFPNGDGSTTGGRIPNIDLPPD
jgi:hypothetical protein